MHLSNAIQDTLTSLTGCQVRVSETGCETFPVELCAAIDFNGSPSGMIRLELSQATADRLSAAMLGFDDPSEIEDDDMRKDAIGEIVNVIAGKIKALRGTTDAVMSMPMVGCEQSATPDMPHDSFSGIFVLGEDVVRITTGWDKPATK